MTRFLTKLWSPNRLPIEAMGFSTVLSTVLLVLARTVGWIVQWSKTFKDPAQRIGRFRELFTVSPEHP
jgi:citrate synthase